MNWIVNLGGLALIGLIVWWFWGAAWVGLPRGGQLGSSRKPRDGSDVDTC